MKKILISAFVGLSMLATLVRAQEDSRRKMPEKVIFNIQNSASVITRTSELLHHIKNPEVVSIQSGNSLVVQLPAFIDADAFNRLVVYLEVLLTADKFYKKSGELLDLNVVLQEAIHKISNSSWDKNSAFVSFFQMALIADYLRIEIKFKSKCYKTDLPYAQLRGFDLYVNVAYALIHEVAKSMVENNLDTDDVLVLFDEQLLPNAPDEYAQNYEKLLINLLEVALPFQAQRYQGVSAFAMTLDDFDFDQEPPVGQMSAHMADEERAESAIVNTPVIEANSSAGASVFLVPQLFPCTECEEVFDSRHQLFGHYAKIHQKESVQREGTAFSTVRTQSKRVKLDKDEFSSDSDLMSEDED